MCLFACIPAHATIIFQSATLGPSGSGGYVVDSGQYLGVRFQLLNTYDVTAVGGDLAGSQPASGAIFAAIVAISGLGPTNFPTNSPASFTPLASATFTPPNPSADIRVALPVTLGPGYYALIFGGGRFGATSGHANMPGLDSDLAGASYFLGQGSSDPGSSWSNDSFSRTRFVVEGNLSGAAVPEPVPAALFGASLGLLLLKRWRTRS